MKNITNIVFLMLSTALIGFDVNEPIEAKCEIVHGDQVSLEIMFSNLTEIPLYIYASHWHLDGVTTGSPGLLAMPWGRGIFYNQVLFFNKNIESSGTRGTMEGSPDFDYFPKVVKVTAEEPANLSIVFGERLSERFKKGDYEFSVSLFYSDNIIDVDLADHDILLNENTIWLEMSDSDYLKPNRVNAGLSNLPYDESKSTPVWDLFTGELFVNCGGEYKLNLKENVE